MSRSTAASRSLSLSARRLAKSAIFAETES